MGGTEEAINWVPFHLHQVKEDKDGKGVAPTDSRNSQSMEEQCSEEGRMKQETENMELG